MRGINTNIKTLELLAAVLFAVLLILSVFLGALVCNKWVTFENRSSDQALFLAQLFPTETPAKQSCCLSPSFVILPNSGNPVGSGPNIEVVHASAEDDRPQPPYSLSVAVLLNNTGSGTAYDAYLHVIAYNNEGVAIDKLYLFGGMTGHVTLGLNCNYNYSGNSIDNCTITPIYTDLFTNQSVVLEAPL